MGKLSPAQEKIAKEKGFIPQQFESFSQERIDQIFPTVSKAPAAAPVVTSEVTPEPPVAPISGLDPRELAIPTESQLEEIQLSGRPLEASREPSPYESAYGSYNVTGAPMVSPAASQPEQKGFPTYGFVRDDKAAKPSYAFQREDVDVSRYGKRQEGLLDLKEAYIYNRSRGIDDQIDPVKETQNRKKAEAILRQKFTPGGGQGSLTGYFAAEPTLDPTFGDVLRPQMVATPAEDQYAKDLEYDSSMRAVDQLQKEYEQALRIYANTSKEKEIQDKLKTLNTSDVITNPDFILRKQEIKEYELRKRASPNAANFPPFQANFEDASTFQKTKAAITEGGTQLATNLFLQEQPGEGIVETPVGYVGRMLGSPVSAGVGVVEGIITDKTVDQAMKERIKEGLSMTGAGLSIADAAIEASGLPKDSGYAQAARYLGGGAGLIIDFLLPVVPGYSAATAGVKAMRGTMAAEKALQNSATISQGSLAALKAGAKATGAEVARGVAPFVTAVPSAGIAALKTAGKGLEDVSNPSSISSISRGTSAVGTALRGAGEAAAEAGRTSRAAGIIAPEFGADVISQSLTKFGTNQDNLQIAGDLVTVLDDVDFKAISKLPEDKKLEALSKMVEDSFNTNFSNRGITFDEWVASTSKVSDPLELKTYASLRGDLPSAIKRASISDSLTTDQKTAIARGSSLSSEEMTKALLDLAIRKNVDIASLNIPAKGIANIKIKPEALMEALVTKSLKAPLQTDKEILKHILYGIGNEKLTKHLLSSPRLSTALPNYTRITRTSFLPSDQAPSAIREFNEKIGPIRDRVVDAIRRGEDVAQISTEQAQAIIDLTAPTSLRYLPNNVQAAVLSYVDELVSEGNVTIKTVITSNGPKRMVVPFRETTPGVINIDVKKYNTLAEKMMDAISSKKSGYKTIFDVDRDLSSIDSNVRSSQITRENYLSKVLTPKEIAGGTFESTLKGVSKSVEASQGSPLPSLSREFSEEISQKWGSIPEDFKSKYRQARGEGLSAPDAWSKVMVDNYIIESRGTTNTLKLQSEALLASGDSITAAAVAGKIFDIEKANYGQMFDDYISMMYGGYEGMAQALQTTGRTRYLDGRLVDPYQVKQLIFVLSQHPFITELRNNFVLAATSGKSTEALLNLRNAHAVVQGRGIIQFIPTPAELTRLYEEAKLVDTNGTLSGSYVGNEFVRSTGGKDNKSMIEIWDYTKDSAPMFFVDDHLELLASQYLTRRQSGIVAETYQDYSKVMPDLFPSNQGIAKNVDSFKYSLSRYMSIRFDDAGNSIVPPLFAKIDAAVPGKKVTIQNPTTGVPSVDVELRDLVAAYYGGTDEVIEAAYRTLFDDKLSTRLYTSLVEDSLTQLSGSTFLPTSYRNLVEKNVSVEPILAEIVNGMEADGVYVTNQLKQDIKGHLNGIYEEALFKQGKEYLKSFSGSSDYIKSIFPKLRQETTPLFFNSMKSSIKQAAKSNLAVIFKGPMEQIDVIPLSATETAKVKEDLLSKTDIKRYTEAMEELSISSTSRKLDDQRLADTLEKAINEGLDATIVLRSGSNKGKSIMDRFTQVVAEAVGTHKGWISDGRLSRAAKGGVLGGNILPNIKYLATNAMTAPAIIYGQLGADSAFTFNYGTVSSIKVLTGGGVGGIVDLRFNPQKTPVEVVVASPSGKVYTNYDIAEIVSANSIARSQASMELTNEVMRDIVSYSGVQYGKIGNTPGGLTSMSRTELGNVLRQNYGPGSNRSMNIYQELGNLTDTAFRTNVLITSLKAGKSEAEAIKLARESLFDYGNLTRLEKDIIGKAFWFWSFRRNAYRLVVKNFLTNPTRMKNAYQANGFLAEIDRDYNLATRDYAQTRPFIFLVNDKENKQRFAVYGPAIPQLDATSQMIDHLSLGLPLLNDSKDGKEKLYAILSGGLDQVGAMSGPGIQTALGLSFGIDVRREGKELGYYLDPKLMAYMQTNPEVWATFSSLINVEKVPNNQEVPGRPTYNGSQWRIQKGDGQSVRVWFAIQQAMLFAGIGRNLREYAPLLTPRLQGEQISPSMGGTNPELSPYIQILNFVGAGTPIEQPKLQDQIEFNKRAIAEEFREGTYKQ